MSTTTKIYDELGDISAKLAFIEVGASSPDLQNLSSDDAFHGLSLYLWEIIDQLKSVQQRLNPLSAAPSKQ
jgi:hypothetical protein